MALDLFMLGLIVKDMPVSLEFYRRLGLAVPDGAEQQTHVEIKMGNGLTFFLDSRPSRWDPGYEQQAPREQPRSAYGSVLEFYLGTRDAVDAKYGALIDGGYRGRAAPYETNFGMYFALIDDPDGNTILLSGDLK